MFKITLLNTIIVSGALFCSSASAAIEGLELLKGIGEYKQRLFVYKSARPSTKDIESRFHSAEIFAKNAGVDFTGEIVRVDDNRLAMSSREDASASFEVDQLTGNFIFESGLQKYAVERDTVGLPSSSDLEDLALKTLRGFDLPINPDELSVAHIGGLNMSVADDSGKSQIFEKLKTIRFSRILGGLPVMGDARVVAHFGEHSTLSGLVYQIPKIQTKQELPGKSIEGAKILQQKALDELSRMAKKAAHSRLKAVDLVLFDDGFGVMEPAYHIELERYIEGLGEEATMIPYDFYLPVSREPIAFFPHMDSSLFVPEDGSDTRAIKPGRAE